MSFEEVPSAETRYVEIVARLSRRPGVTQSEAKGFGASALVVEGRIFAMLTRGRLVVKLPKPRVDELVAAGRGQRFDANRGRPMKEWVSMGPDEGDWASLAEEAYGFVGPLSAGRKKASPAVDSG